MSVACLRAGAETTSHALTTYQEFIIMPVMLSNTYDALVDAGASTTKAAAAAEELAGYESRFSGMDAALAAMRTDVDAALAAIRSDVAVLKWLGGANTTLILLVLGKLFLSH
jgi:hypothetical protein